MVDEDDACTRRTRGGAFDTKPSLDELLGRGAGRIVRTRQTAERHHQCFVAAGRIALDACHVVSYVPGIAFVGVQIQEVRSARIPRCKDDMPRIVFCWRERHPDWAIALVAAYDERILRRGLAFLARCSFDFARGRLRWSTRAAGHARDDHHERCEISKHARALANDIPMAPSDFLPPFSDLVAPTADKLARPTASTRHSGVGARVPACSREERAHDRAERGVAHVIRFS